MNPTSDVIDELNALGRSGQRELVTAMSLSAKRIAQRKKWASSNPLGTVAGIEEFVSNVFEKVIAGTRQWTRASSHTLRQHLFSVLRSEIDNLAKGKDNTAREDADFFEPAAPSALLDEQLHTARWVARVQDVVFQAVDGDQQLRVVAELWLDGVEKPAELAQEVGCSVSDMNVRLRKLRRRLENNDALGQIKGEDQ